MLPLFKQLIRFVNGDMGSFFFARADCRTKSGGYAIISRPNIATVKDLKGKGWRSTRSAARRISRSIKLLSRNGLDANKDVISLSIAGSPHARFAALIGGAVDASV